MFNLVHLLQTAGYLGIFLIIFAESGILIGFFLPGDSLLFTAGFLASQGFLHIALLIAVAALGAILGDGLGYYLGWKFGPKIFNRPDSIFFSHKQVMRTEVFFKTHGGKAIIFARFVPVVRTLAPIFAGVGNMHYPHFLKFNVIGAGLWAAGLPLLGYFLGRAIPDVDRYLLPIVILIVIVSLIPNAIHILKDPEMRQKIKSLLHLA